MRKKKNLPRIYSSKEIQFWYKLERINWPHGIKRNLTMILINCWTSIIVFPITWTHSIFNSSYFIKGIVQFSSVTQSCPTLWPHEPQYASPLCPLPTPGVYPNSWPLSRWWHPTISSSGIPFSFCPQSFPSLGLFKWFSSSHQVAKVLEFQLQHQSFQCIFRTDFL